MKTALVLIDHGSVRTEANEMLEELARQIHKRGIYPIVVAAHMELAEPSLEEAIAQCVAQGARRVIVHPYFLSPGRHSQKDIPRMTAEAAAKFPGIEVILTEPLGIDDRIIEVVLLRAAQALAANRRVSPPVREKAAG